jgi:hypothetical protein
MATELPAPRSCFECVNCVSVCVAGALETCVVDLFGQPVERRGAEDLDSEDENVLVCAQCATPIDGEKVKGALSGELSPASCCCCYC